MNLILFSEKRNKNNKGFAIMEVLVALFLITSGIIGSYILISSTISSTNYASDRFTANYLAQEGIELVRNIRDTNWLEPYSEPPVPYDRGLIGGCSGSCDGASGQGCITDYFNSWFYDVDLSDGLNPHAGPYNNQYLKYDPIWLYNYTDGSNTKFKRQININWINAYSFEVCVWVGWEDKETDHFIIVRENLYDWR